MAKKKPTIVSLDPEQVEWLERKRSEGYSKSGLIRHAVKRLMAEPATSKKVKVANTQPEDITKTNKVETDKTIKKLEIEKILDVLIEMAELGYLDKKGIPNILDAAKSTQQQFQNIDHLYPRTAFELGIFKVEMETAFNQAMQKERGKTKS